MDEDKKLSYFCLGLGIGVAVGILFAPKSGEETRQFWALRMLDRLEEREAEWRRLLLIAPSFSSLAQPDLARRLERIFFTERLPRSPK